MDRDRAATGCWGKARYDSYGQATRMVKRERRHKDRDRAALEPYRCRNCHGFHLGRKMPELSKRLLREYLRGYRPDGYRFEADAP